ncbi:MAG: WcaI family glycosyltransferase [Pseudomonadota bacterium]
MNAELKIAVISINYAPELTGIAVYTTGMAEHFAREAPVTVYTGFSYYPQWKKQRPDQGVWYRREQRNGVDLRRSYIYVPSRPSAWKRMLHELSFVFSVSIAYLCGPRADCTVVVGPPLVLGLPVTLIAKLKKSRVIFHVQDLQPDAAVDLGMLKPGWMVNMLFTLERWTYRLADRVSTISEGMRKKIVYKGVQEDKVFIFPNWANAEQIIPKDSNTAYRKEWGLADSAFVVLYAGNMGVKQGLGTLLEAAALLDGLRNIFFVIVGEGGEKYRLTTQALRLGLKNVRFVGVQPFERLPDLLATADVSVVPQKKGVHDIVLPSKICNIMASQRPLIAAAPQDSEFARLVTESASGLVVEPEDPVTMADAIKLLYGAEVQRKTMGYNGRRYVERHLGYNAILGKFLGTMKDLVREGG